MVFITAALISNKITNLCEMLHLIIHGINGQNSPSINTTLLKIASDFMYKTNKLTVARGKRHNLMLCFFCNVYIFSIKLNK